MLLSSYEPLWEALKSASPEIKYPRTRKLSVAANRALHPRIIKAVTKRKWLDLGYKLQIEPHKAILTHSRTGSKITFFLTVYYSEHITAKDLGL